MKMASVAQSPGGEVGTSQQRIDTALAPKKCGFAFGQKDGTPGRVPEPVVMSQALYKPGGKIQNHMRVVGDVTPKLHQVRDF